MASIPDLVRNTPKSECCDAELIDVWGLTETGETRGKARADKATAFALDWSANCSVITHGIDLLHTFHQNGMLHAKVCIQLFVRVLLLLWKLLSMSDCWLRF